MFLLLLGVSLLLHYFSKLHPLCNHFVTNNVKELSQDEDLKNEELIEFSHILKPDMKRVEKNQEMEDEATDNDEALYAQTVE